MREQIKIFVLRLDLNRIFKFWTAKKSRKKFDQIDKQSQSDLAVKPLVPQITNEIIVQDSSSKTEKEPKDI